MKVPAYPEYKESGFKWLGPVPGHWEVKRSDEIISSDRNQVQPDNFKDEEVFHYSIPAVQEYGTGIIEDGESIASAKQVIKEKCLLVSKLNPRKATICIAEPKELKTLCSTEFVVLKARKCLLSFLTYFTQTELFRQGLDSKVQSVTRSHQRAAPDDIYKFWAAWPPLPEQTAIADFLGRETGRIDTLVAKKRRLIALLKEKRTALISRTVTRGLPAAVAREFGLEPHTRFKDSGIEWLGQVPEGWAVTKGRYIGSLLGSVTVSEDDFQDADGETGISYAKVDDLNRIDVSLTLENTNARVIGYRALGAPFLLFPKRGAAIFTNKVAIALRPMLFDPNLMGWRVNSSFNIKFVAYCLIARRLDDLADVSTVPQINNKHINPSGFPYPPLQEQTAIATYLDRETAKVDKLVEKVEAAISRLQEYRTALITAAVTGKIDVREAVA